MFVPIILIKIDKLWQIDRLKAEKARNSKYHKKKVAYVETNNNDQEFNIAYVDVEENEVNNNKMETFHGWFIHTKRYSSHVMNLNISKYCTPNKIFSFNWQQYQETQELRSIAKLVDL